MQVGSLNSNGTARKLSTGLEVSWFDVFSGKHDWLQILNVTTWIWWHNFEKVKVLLWLCRDHMLHWRILLLLLKVHTCLTSWPGFCNLLQQCQTYLQWDIYTVASFAGHISSNWSKFLLGFSVASGWVSTDLSSLIFARFNNHIAYGPLSQPHIMLIIASEVFGYIEAPSATLPLTQVYTLTN